MLVNVVPGEDHNVFRVIATNDVEVLGDRIRRSAIPVLAVNALLRRKEIDKFVHLFAEE